MACLEVVHFREHGASAITVQLALDGKLTVSMTTDRQTFWGYEDHERHEWLKRTARTLLDIFGDARDGRVLSDQEVQQRAAG